MTKKSKWVAREVSRALSEEKIVIPFRIEDTKLEGNLALMLGNIHWLNAVPPEDKHINNLTKKIKSLLEVKEIIKNPKTPKGKTSKPKKKLKKEIKPLKYSPGLILGWQIAGLEVNYTKHEYMGIDHVFIGICSLEKILLDNKVMEKLSPRVTEYVQKENNEIIDIFWNLRLDIRQLRREVRGLINIDNYEI